jgi:cyclopropane fatty-acyl-phospholipid synthase-like methyltransferase
MIGQTQGCIADLKHKMGYVSLGEIGCGYGSFFDNFINTERYEKIDYRGFDIIPRTVSTVEIEGNDGCFSKQQEEKYQEKFNLFFSSNTFQHLSKKQVEKYSTQVYDMLPYGGYFNVMYANESTSYHYGQKIELFDLDSFKSLIKRIGFSIMGSSTLEIPNSLTPHSFLLRK